MNVVIETERMRLVPHAPEDVQIMLDAMSPEDRAQVSPVWLARAQAATEPDVWILGCALIHRETGERLGTCAFKNPPGPDGVVEIAYGVAPTYEGRGYATEAAAALTAFAFDQPDIRLVCAHTLSTTNASARVLTKCGFNCVGQVVDPEDGLVWRWERSRPSV